MLNHKTTAAIVAAIALAGPAPAALAQSPDAIDAAQGRYPGSSPTFQDLRSPDARDVAQSTQDLRSPDARDAATRAPVGHEPIPAPRVIRVVPGGFDWGDAAIGAGGMLGLVLIATAAALAVPRQARLRTRA
jgi:hypothetical protein